MSEYYRKLVDGIEDVEVRQVARIMSFHVGEENAIDLSDITMWVYKISTPNNKRKVRAILEKLTTEYGIPIGGHSGNSGRWICETPDELQSVIAELSDHMVSVQQRINALRAAKLPGHSYPLPDTTMQYTLFGG